METRIMLVLIKIAVWMIVSVSTIVSFLGLSMAILEVSGLAKLNTSRWTFYSFTFLTAAIGYTIFALCIHILNNMRKPRARTNNAIDEDSQIIFAAEIFHSDEQGVMDKKIRRPERMVENGKINSN